MSEHEFLPRPEQLLQARVWKVACGAEGRHYLNAFVDHSVALVGSWGIREAWYHPDFEVLNPRQRSSIKTLAERIHAGDIVLATRGVSEALAIGIAVEGEDGVYEHNPTWGEVEGWDLFHQIRVRWNRLPQSKRFPQRPFARQTAAEVHDHAAREWARRCAASVRAGEGFDALRDTPQEQPRLDESTLDPAFQRAIDAARELNGAYDWHEISESTVVALIVAPLLRELGWTVSQLRLEWRIAGKPVDVAVFGEDSDRPTLIVEAKAAYKGVTAAYEQALDYVKPLGEHQPWILAATGLLLSLHAPGGGEPLRAYLLEPTESARELFSRLATLR